MLITGYEVPPVHHAAIVIDGNKIVAAGPASEVKIPADARAASDCSRRRSRSRKPRAGSHYGLYARADPTSRRRKARYGGLDLV